MQNKCRLSLLQLAGRLGIRASAPAPAPVEGGPVQAANGRWVILPPVPAVPKSNDLLLPTQRRKPVIAIAWLKQCCPQISQQDADILFRTGQVKIHVGAFEASDSEKLELKKITRKEVLAEGTILCLPTHSLQVVNERRPTTRLNTIPKIGESISNMDDESSKGQH